MLQCLEACSLQCCMLGVSMLVLEEKANLNVYARPAVKGICKSHNKKKLIKFT